MNKLVIVIVMIATITSCSKNFTRANIFKPSPNIKDHTTLLQKIINTYDSIYIPAGTYNISQLIIPSKKTIITDGLKTKIKQIPSPIGTPIILISGSEVYLDSISLEGNINIDEGEWSHGVAVMSNRVTTKDIEIVGLHVKNVRGDGLYIGNSDGISNCKSIKAKYITVENCFRNGVSIVSGEDISIENVSVKCAGLYGVDIEGDPPKIALKNIYLNNISGPGIGIIGSGEIANNITIKNIIADGMLSGSSPVYKHKALSGLIIRNAKNVIIDSIEIKNFNKFAVEFICEKGDALNESVDIKNITIRDVSQNENIYNAYILMIGIKSFKINGLNTEIKYGKTLFLGNDTPKNQLDQLITISNANTVGGSFARYTRVIGDNLNLNNCEYCLQKLHKGSVISNSKISGQVINSLSIDTRFVNTTFNYIKAKFENCRMQFENDVKTSLE